MVVYLVKNAIIFLFNAVTWKESMKLRIGRLLIVIGMCCLVACAPTPSRVPGSFNPPVTQTTAGAVVGGTGALMLSDFFQERISTTVAVFSIMGGALGNYYDTVGFAEKVEKMGGQVMVVGSQVKIILPSDALFEPAEVELKDEASPFLARLGKVLMTFGPVPMEITGYTDNIMFTDDYNQNFAARQAQSVAAYLWAHGIPNQTMKVQGFGTTPDVATNRSLAGSAANRRIEITLWRQSNANRYYAG